jgi:uncharacterized protein YciI
MYALFYEYVENILERRAPFREEHLQKLAAVKAEIRLLMGGALGDPPHGALIVFDVDDVAVVEDWVQNDPYVINGLVAEHRIEPWNVVT